MDGNNFIELSAKRFFPKAALTETVKKLLHTGNDMVRLHVLAVAGFRAKVCTFL